MPLQASEASAVAQAGELLASVMAGYAAARPEEEAGAVEVEAAAGREYMHSATRHCYYQRAMLQLMLRQLRFCAAELQGAPPEALRLGHLGQTLRHMGRRL